jgi:hypothetical protein
MCASMRQQSGLHTPCTVLFERDGKFLALAEVSMPVFGFLWSPFQQFSSLYTSASAKNLPSHSNHANPVPNIGNEDDFPLSRTCPLTPYGPPAHSVTSKPSYAVMSLLFFCHPERYTHLPSPRVCSFSPSSRAERSRVEGSHPSGNQQRRSLDYGCASAQDDSAGANR